MAAPAISSATAAAGAESPKSKRQSVVTALSTEKGGSSGTISSSKGASVLAPQEHNDSEAMDGIAAPSDGGLEWVEYWDESTDASYFYNTITQVGCQEKEGEIRGGPGIYYSSVEIILCQGEYHYHSFT